MTLGRTSSGAIKLKTDTAGGGLRAVECACCQPPCGCGREVGDQLLQVLRNATTGTCNGFPPIYWNSQGGGFGAMWELPNGIYYTASLSALAATPNNCIAIYSLDYNGITIGDDPAVCCPAPLGPFDTQCTPAGNFLVNGYEFPAINVIYEPGQPLIAPAVFVFS